MPKYLDENGVARLWERIQKLIYECCKCESSGGGGECDCEALTIADIDEVTPTGGDINAV